MTRIILTTCALLALTACRFDAYYAEGVTIASRDRDRAQCQAEAQRALPERMVTRFTPRQFHPGTTVCDAANICVINAPYWTGGDPYTVDLNEDQREGAVTSCMAARGYTLISLPSCPTGAPIAASTRMAPLTTDTCLLNRRNGGLIVNP